jgi:integrase
VLNSLRSFYAYGLDTAQLQRSPLLGIGLPNRRRGPAPLTMPAAWAEPANQWRDWLLAAGRSAGTLHVRFRWLRALAESYSDPWSISPGDLAVFLSRTDWSPEYRRQGHASLRGFYAWAEHSGLITTSPARYLPAVRVPRTVPRPAPDDAVSIALAQADDRTRLAIYLAAYAGLRRGEVAAVHCHDIGLGALRVKGKGGHERLVPLHPELDAALRAEMHRRREGHPASGWTTHADPDGWLFPSDDPSEHLTAQWVGSLIKRTLPAGWTTHHLRHRFATQAYAVERDLRAVQELLGHSSPTTTTRYAAVPAEAVSNAVSGIPALPTAAHQTSASTDNEGHAHAPAL